jgi:hypothetical protein
LIDKLNWMSKVRELGLVVPKTQDYHRTIEVRNITASSRRMLSAGQQGTLESVSSIAPPQKPDTDYPSSTRIKPIPMVLAPSMLMSQKPKQVHVRNPTVLYKRQQFRLFKNEEFKPVAVSSRQVNSGPSLLDHFDIVRNFGIQREKTLMALNQNRQRLKTEPAQPKPVSRGKKIVISRNRINNIDRTQ